MKRQAKRASACQLLAAARCGSSRASSIGDQSAVDEIHAHFARPAAACSTAARMCRTPSAFVRKQSHNSPVIVTASRSAGRRRGDQFGQLRRPSRSGRATAQTARCGPSRVRRPPSDSPRRCRVPSQVMAKSSHCRRRRIRVADRKMRRGARFAVRDRAHGLGQIRFGRGPQTRRTTSSAAD